MAHTALLRTLSSPSLTVGDTTVPLRHSEAAMLAFIALAPKKTVDRERLAKFLRPSAPISNARASLSQMLYRIKQIAPIDIFVISPMSICTPLLTTDIELVRESVKKGDSATVIEICEIGFLANLHSPPTAADWRDGVDLAIATEVAQMLEESMLRSPEKDFESAVVLLERFYSDHPYNAVVARVYVAALLRAGDLDTVRKIYDSQASDYDSELPDLQLLLSHSILQDSTLDGEARKAAFVGRASELNSLMEAWTKSARGICQIVLVLGEPGIGKSRLADQFLRRVAIRGGRIWSACCNAATQRLPFANVADLIDEAAAGRAIHPSEYSVPSLNLDTNGSTEERKHLLVRELTSLVKATSVEIPLVIFIDDAQWADELMSVLLQVWARKLINERVLILLTVRSHDVSPIPRWLTEINPTLQITLGQLSPDAVTALVSSVRADEPTTDPVLLDQVVDQCAGRPFLLLEALSMMSSHGSRLDRGAVALGGSAELLLRQRFDQIHTHANWIAGILAVYGKGLRLPELIDLCELSYPDMAAALEILSERGIVSWKRDAVHFPHDLMKETAYRRLSASTRSLLHLRVARHYLNSGGDSSLLAQHYAGAADQGNAGKFAMLAAESALARHHYADGEYYFKLAIDSGTDGHRRQAAYELIKYLLQVGRAKDAGVLLGHLDQDSVETRILREMIAIETSLGEEHESAIQLVERASALIELAASSRLHELGPCFATIVDVALDAGEREFDIDLIATLEEAISASSSPSLSVDLVSVLAIWEAVRSSTEDALRRLETVSEIVAEDPSTSSHAQWWNSYGTVMLLSANLPAALSSLEQAMIRAQRTKDLRQQVVVRMNTGVALLEAARFEEAQTQFEIVNSSPNIHFRLRSRANLAVLHFEYGSQSECLRIVDSLEEDNRLYRSQTFANLGFALKGLWALRRSDLEFAEKCNSSISLSKGESDEATYVTHFIASMYYTRGEHMHARQLIRQAAERARPRDRLSYMRLLCDDAELTMRDSPDAGYAGARSVLDMATHGGAELIKARAAKLIEFIGR